MTDPCSEPHQHLPGVLALCSPRNASTAWYTARHRSRSSDGLALELIWLSGPKAQPGEAAAAFSDASLATDVNAWTRAQVEAPALPRLHLAQIESAFLLCGGTRVPVPLA